MSYIRKVSSADRKKWMKKIDELLDIEFEKTVKKIRNDIEEKATSTMEEIMSGKIKRATFVVRGYINFTNLTSATLPIIMNDELTWAYVEASGRWTDNLGAFNAYSKKYDLYVFSSKKHGIHFYAFKFYKGEMGSPIANCFLTKTGKKFCDSLRRYFEGKNIKLNFECHDGTPDCIDITVKCNKKSTK